jgi:hypothetical protein
MYVADMLMGYCQSWATSNRSGTVLDHVVDRHLSHRNRLPMGGSPAAAMFSRRNDMASRTSKSRSAGAERGTVDCDAEKPILIYGRSFYWD